MATQVFDSLVTGLGTLTLRLYVPGTNTDLTAPTPPTAAEDGSRNGLHVWTISDSLAGVLHDAEIINSIGQGVGNGEVVPLLDGSKRITPAFDERRVWSTSPRTLTQTANQVVAAVTGDSWTVLRGDTIADTFTIGDITTRTNLWVTAKTRWGRTDAKAMLQISELSGLIAIDGRAPASGETGSVVVTNAVTGELTVNLSAAAAAQLDVTDDADYDIQVLNASGVVDTLSLGRFIVLSDVTRRTS